MRGAQRSINASQSSGSGAKRSTLEPRSETNGPKSSTLARLRSASEPKRSTLDLAGSMNGAKRSALQPPCSTTGQKSSRLGPLCCMNGPRSSTGKAWRSTPKNQIFLAARIAIIPSAAAPMPTEAVVQPRPVQASSDTDRVKVSNSRRTSGCFWDRNRNTASLLSNLVRYPLARTRFKTSCP